MESGSDVLVLETEFTWGSMNWELGGLGGSAGRPALGGLGAIEVQMGPERLQPCQVPLGLDAFQTPN